MTTQSGWRTALHEAGHVAAAVILGDGVQSVTIVPTEVQRGTETIQASGVARRRIVPLDGADLIDHEFRKAVMIAAGRAAEEAFGVALQDGRGASGDDQDLAALADLMRLDLTHLQPQHLRRWAEFEAVALIDKHHDVVEEIARELMRCGTLSGDDVDRIAAGFGITTGSGSFNHPEMVWLMDTRTGTSASRTRRAPSATGEVRHRLAPGLGVRPSTHDASSRSIEATIATRTPVRRPWGWEILSMTDINLERVDLQQVRLLDSHDSGAIDKILGRIDHAWVEGDELRARITFADTPSGRAAEGSVVRGDLSGLSVGYAVTSERLLHRDDAGIDVFEVGWQLLEVSAVAVPADPHARFRGASLDTNTVARMRARMTERQRAAEARLAAIEVARPAGGERGVHRRPDGSKVIDAGQAGLIHVPFVISHYR